MRTEQAERTILTTQQEVADVFGVHRRTFAEWLARGCPGRPGRYVLSEILEWVTSVIDGRCMHCGQQLAANHPLRNPQLPTEDDEP